VQQKLGIRKSTIWLSQTKPALTLVLTIHSQTGEDQLNLSKTPPIERINHSGFLFFFRERYPFSLRLGIVFFLSEEAIQFFRSPEVSPAGISHQYKWQPHLATFGILLY